MGKALRVPEGLGVAEGIHRAVDLAREAARGYSSTQVETEHLLLGQNLDTMSGFCRVPGEQTLPLGNVEPGEEKRRHEDRHRSTRTAPRGPVPRNPEHPDQAREHPGVVRDEEVPLSGLRARLLSGT